MIRPPKIINAAISVILRRQRAVGDSLGTCLKTIDLAVVVLPQRSGLREGPVDLQKAKAISDDPSGIAIQTTRIGCSKSGETADPRYI